MKAATALDQVGHHAQQPHTWAAVAALLAVAGRKKGRRAALRGTVSYVATAVIANNIIKPLVRRPRPAEAREGIGPVTSSFPSGHSATDVAFTLAAAQEVPALFFPLSAMALAAHWSIVRSRGHFTSDVFVGGLVGTAVALVVWKVWPPGEEAPDDGAALGSPPGPEPRIG